MLCEGTAFAKVVRLDPEKLRVSTTEGVQLVVKTLGGVWGQSRLEKKYERFERAIFGTIQKPDGTHASYLARHEVQYEDLLSMGATLTEMRAYILLRNSGLSSEDKKKIIVDANGELLYDKVTSALQLLGSKFFGEVQQGATKNPTRTKTYDANMVDESEHDVDEPEDTVFYAAECSEEAVYDILIAEGDEDALVMSQFEDAIMETLQSDPEAECPQRFKSAATASAPASGAPTAFAGMSLASEDQQPDSDGDLLADLPENAVAFTLEEVRNVSKLQHGRPMERNDPKCGSTSPRPDPLGPNLQTINAESSFFVAHGSSGIVDLGASMSVIGQKQFSELCQSLPKHVRDSMKEAPCTVSFRFGNNSMVTGKKAVFFPIGPFWMKVIVVPSNTPFLIANSVFRSLGAVIDTDANQVFFKRLDRSIPIVLTERKLYRLDMMDLLTASPHVPKEQDQPADHAKCDAAAFQLTEDQVTMASSGQFDQLADRLRRMSLDNQASSEAVEQVMEMSLEELKECRIDFGKAHLNKKYQDMVGETRYLTWFAETYRHSQKICHMKFLRFIQLHLDQMEGQMHQARSKTKAKAKTVSRPRDHPELPHDPWNPSSDEEIEIPWEPVTNSEEVTRLTERMTEMEGMLQQILGHLSAPSTRPPMA
eukprot:s990_g32.t1